MWLTLYQVLAGNITHNHYKLGTTTNLSLPFQVLGLWLQLPFQVLGLWLQLKEMLFLGLGLTVTEHQKSTETKAKVNIQNPIPTVFLKRCRD